MADNTRSNNTTSEAGSASTYPSVAALTESQRAALSRMRGLFPDEQQYSDSDLLRFLRARKYDVDAASTMLNNYINWRKEFGTDGILTPSDPFADEIKKELERRLIVLHGEDNIGNPICWVFFRRYLPGKVDINIVIRSFIYIVEQANKRMKPPVEGLSVVIDFAGFGYQNFDSAAMTAAREYLAMVQNYYPEQLCNCFCINCGFIFRTLWAVVKPWLDTYTASKTYVLGSDYAMYMAQYMDVEKVLPPDCFDASH